MWNIEDTAEREAPGVIALGWDVSYDARNDNSVLIEIPPYGSWTGAGVRYEERDSNAGRLSTIIEADAAKFSEFIGRGRTIAMTSETGKTEVSLKGSLAASVAFSGCLEDVRGR